MQETISGLIAGIISSLGMGGGTILIIILNKITDLSQQMLQGINLLFFIPTACIAIVINYKRKLIRFKESIIILFSGCIGSCIGAIVSLKIDSNNLKKYFGIFLLVIAIFEIISIIKKNKNK